MSDALDNIRMATGGGDVQRRPSLAVGLVDAGVLIQKEGHHVHAAIYAGLRGRKQEQVLGHCHTASLCSRMFEDAKDRKKKTNKDVNRLCAQRHCTNNLLSRWPPAPTESTST